MFYLIVSLKCEGCRRKGVSSGQNHFSPFLVEQQFLLFDVWFKNSIFAISEGKLCLSNEKKIPVILLCKALPETHPSSMHGQLGFLWKVQNSLRSKWGMQRRKNRLYLTQSAVLNIAGNNRVMALSITTVLRINRFEKLHVMSFPIGFSQDRRAGGLVRNHSHY